MARHAQARFVLAFGASQKDQKTQLTDTNLPQTLQLANPEFIAAGASQSAAITSDGELFIWGLVQQTSAEPLLVLRRETNSPIVSSPCLVLPHSKLVAVDDNTALVVTQQGTIVSLTDTTRPYSSLTDVTAVISRFNVQIVFAHDQYYVFSESGDAVPRRLTNGETPQAAAICSLGYSILSNDSKLYTFPYDSSDFLTADVVSVAASNDRFVILKSNGRVYEMFANGARRQVGGIDGNPIRLFAGGAHFGCITFEGHCWMWGCGNRGQLGNGRFTVAFTPAKVLVKDGLCVVDGAAGEEHTLLLAAKEEAFIPKLPDGMREDPYMAMVRMASALPGAFIASELDSKF
jgi:alpha-tubulin suppressor-like RCC1 family protein